MWIKLVIEDLTKCYTLLKWTPFGPAPLLWVAWRHHVLICWSCLFEENLEWAEVLDVNWPSRRHWKFTVKLFPISLQVLLLGNPVDHMKQKLSFEEACMNERGWRTLRMHFDVLSHVALVRGSRFWIIEKNVKYRIKSIYQFI